MSTIRTRTAASREPLSRGAVARPGKVEGDLRPWEHDPWDEPGAVRTDLEPVRKQRWPFKVIVYTLGVLLIAGVLVGGGVGWWYIQQINPEGDPAPAINFTVNEGETVESLSFRLKEQGLIESASVFRWYVERHGGLELTPGYYRLRPRDHMGNLMAVLQTPPTETYTSVTFPEGYTLTRMATRLAERSPRFLVSDFIKAAESGEIRSEFLAQPPEIDSLEGLLFPDTYQVSNGESVEQVINRMLGLMERVGRQENIIEKGYVQRLDAYQVLIVASLVEREAKTEEDRPLIARVILNRLRRVDENGLPNFPLQIDAALYYRQDPNLDFSLLRQIDHPYNTYLHPGLPPTPIASPGRASIQAVLNPAPNPPEGGELCQFLPDGVKCEYLYYVLAEADGSHAFAVTLEQHEANVAKAAEAGLLP